MDDRHLQRVRTLLSHYTNSISSLLTGNSRFRKLRLLKSNLPKLTVIPFAALSTTFLTGFSNKAYALSTNIDTYQNLTDWSILPNGTSTIIDSVQNIPDAMSNVFNTLSNIIDWFKSLPDHIASFTVNLMTDIYGLISNLILKTPLWIFDNQWFDNTTYLFSIIAVGIVTILTLIEGMKRMFKKKSVDIKTIGRRWFIVAGLSTFVPFLFHKGFQFLNFISDTIINMSTTNMSNMINMDIAIFDLIVLVMFNIAMIGMAVPILLKNARRFWDILTLAVVSPIAGVAYIFDSHKHLFNQWWSNLKQLSLVQIVYAFYLLLMGAFIYGVPTPDDPLGITIKILMVIGGFYRLTNPPNFVKRYLDKGDGFHTDVANQQRQTNNVVKDGIKTGINIVKSPKKLISAYNQSASTSNTPKNTRMNRNHGK